MHPYNLDLIVNARSLRRDMTAAEQLLWHHLRRKQILGQTFNRQKPLGPYIVDFYCSAARLVVELDGSQHLLTDGMRTDQMREDYLCKLGLTVLRFNNRQALLETAAVLENIRQAVATGIRP